MILVAKTAAYDLDKFYGFGLGVEDPTLFRILPDPEKAIDVMKYETPKIAETIFSELVGAIQMGKKVFVLPDGVDYE